jgi:hypothetical protein
MGGISASELLATLSLSSLKGLLGLAARLQAALLLAYLSVALTQAGWLAFPLMALVKSPKPT